MPAYLAPDALVRRLLDAAPEALREWFDGASGSRRFTLRSRVEAVRGVATVEREDTESLEDAIRWMVESAKYLVGMTVFEGQRMAKDEVGASGSTYAALRNYATMGEDAPLEVHADATELLRIHSYNQLERADFARAYDAVREAMHAKGLKMPREGVQTYIGNADGAKKLRGGGSYALDRARRQLVAEVGYNDGFVKDMRAGALNGIARYRDAARKDFALVVDPRRTADFARVVRKHGFTELADAFDQLGGYWKKTLVRDTEERRPDTERRPESASIRSTPDAGVIPAEGTRWRWEPDQMRLRLYTPEMARDVARRVGNGASFGVDDAPDVAYDDKYFVSLPTRGALLTAILAGLASTYPRTVEAMRAHLPAWTATASALKQAREQGATEEGRWALEKRKKRTTKGIVEIEYLRIYPAYSVRDPETRETIKWWRSIPGASATVENRQFFVTTPVRRMGKVTEVLREHYPRLAEAIARAFGGVAGAVDEEAEACAARVDLHDKLRPEDATHPDAVEAIDAVERAFAARVPLGLSPLPFQTVGIAFAKLTDYRTLIGDAPGLGKTIQGLGCLITDPEMLLPAVIVAPASVATNWIDEAAKWLPSVPRRLIETGADEIPRENWRGITVMSWDMMVAHQDEILAAGTACIIADEAHYAKNPKAQRTKSLVAIAEKVPHVVLLTGTPIKNVVVELHTLLAALDPQTWGTRKAFGEAYAAKQKKTPGGGTNYEGVKDTDALRLRLACSTIRRLKEDALKDLPAKERVYFEVPLKAGQRAEYDQAEEDFLEWYEGAVEDRVRAALLAEGIDPSSASASAREQAQERAAAALNAQAIVKLGELRRVVGRAKVAPAIELAKRLIAEGENIVIFAVHKPVIAEITKALTAAGIPYGKIAGDTPQKERGDIVRAFQAGQLRAVVASEAAKEGITLTRAANTLFVERFWTPADEQQAEDRIHRIGQKRPVVITYLHVPDTVDDRMDEIIRKKRAIVAQVLGDDDIEEQDRAETQADFVRFLIAGRRGPPPPDLQPIKNAGAASARTARANPGPRVATIRRSEVQAILFDRAAWTPKTAAHWLRVNGYRASAITETARSLFAEQRHADNFRPGAFRTVPLTATVRAIVGRVR